ncbi:MAG: hypothetical protein QOH91_4229 [Mycobacterium sp.]|jgi:hypothetical protein|nr:hypothetical protein [Mycobacterium sp.]
MSYPSGPYGGSPEWQGQQPGWGQQPGYQQQPDNYLVWAILCTVLCCLPFGIVSLVYSNKVSGLWASGQYAESQAAANSAKKWAIIGAITGAITYAIVTVLYIALVVWVVHDMPSTPTSTYSGY